MNTEATPNPPNNNLKNSARALFLGGVLPVIAFALVEEWYGTIGGLIAGILFGAGELAYEYFRFKKIQGVTIAGNALVIVLGGISLLDGSPIFFKLQPAILIFAFAGFMLISSVLKKPLLVEMSKKQMGEIPPEAAARLAGLNVRIGFVLIAIGLISVHAAFYWSTTAWAFLKGIGAPAILFAYMGIEIFLMRRNAPRK
jgi:intracellular septation protein